MEPSYLRLSRHIKIVGGIIFGLVLIYVSLRIGSRYVSGWRLVTLTVLVPVPGFFLAILNVRKYFEERRVLFDFGIDVENHRAVLWVSNISRHTIRVSTLRTRTDRVDRDYPINLTVKEGQETFDITESLLATIGNSLWDDVEISLQYVAPTRAGTSHRKPFNIFAPERIVERVRPMFDQISEVSCPKCRKITLFTPAGLTSMDDIPKRKLRVEKDLKKSCPSHDSRWLYRPKEKAKFF